MWQKAETAGSWRRCRDRLADPDPLVGAVHVVGVLARGEQLAEDLLEHEEVVDLAARDRGQRLVEQHHALLGAVGVHEARAEVGERHELEVGVAVSAGDPSASRKGPACGRGRRSNMPMLSATQPAWASRPPAREQGARPGEPAAHHRAVADDRAVHVRERPGDQDGAQQLAGGSIGGVGQLPALDRPRVVELEVVLPGQAFDLGR